MPHAARHQISSDPNNTHWARDSSRFGLRMLQRMGWSQGDGLGRSRQGTTDHIHVQVRPDTQGLGFEEGGGNWKRHASDLEDVLRKLQQAHDSPKMESESLPTHSQIGNDRMKRNGKSKKNKKSSKEMTKTSDVKPDSNNLNRIISSSTVQSPSAASVLAARPGAIVGSKRVLYSKSFRHKMLTKTYSAEDLAEIFQSPESTTKQSSTLFSGTEEKSIISPNRKRRKIEQVSESPDDNLSKSEDRRGNKKRKEKGYKTKKKSKTEKKGGNSRVSLNK